MREELDLILSRVTPKALTEPAPSTPQQALLLAAAEAAPDYGRLKPWRFLAISGAGRDKLAAAMLAAIQAKKPDLTEAEIAQERTEAQRKAYRAPLILAVSVQYQDSPKVSRAEQRDAVAAAAQNIQLAAHAMGFGCHWRTGPFVTNPVFCSALGLAPDDELVAMLYIGTIATPAAPRALAAGTDHLTVWA